MSSLYKYGGGDGHFIRSSDIKDGTKARILGAPFETTYGLGTPEQKQLLTFPMEVQGVDGDQWSPGKFAIGRLASDLGEDWTTWPAYPIEGVFKILPWKNSKGQTGYSVQFVADKNTKKQEVITPIQKVECPSCDLNFDGEVAMMQHFKSMHTKKKATTSIPNAGEKK